LHPDPSVGSESCQFGWHVRYHVMDGRVQGGGCGILELGIRFLLMLNSLRDWERAYLHFDCIHHVTCALRLQYIFSLHIASHIVSTIFLRPTFLCLCLDTYFGVFFPSILAFRLCLTGMRHLPLHYGKKESCGDLKLACGNAFGSDERRSNLMRWTSSHRFGCFMWELY
jgi:hypothetical protein